VASVLTGSIHFSNDSHRSNVTQRDPEVIAAGYLFDPHGQTIADAAECCGQAHTILDDQHRASFFSAFCAVRPAIRSDQRVEYFARICHRSSDIALIC
jgi:hypothetical protein